MPDNIHVDVSAPIIRRMNSAPPVFLSCSFIPASMLCHGIFKYNMDMKITTADVIIKDICDGPAVRSSPNIFTPMMIIATSSNTGKMDKRIPGFFISCYMPLKSTSEKARDGILHLEHSL